MEYASQLWDRSRRQTKYVRSEFPEIIRNHRKRMLKSVGVSLLPTGLGFMTLWMLANVAGFSALMALAVNTPCMSLISFFLNKFVWRDRETKTNQGLKRWACKEGGFHAASWLFFAVMLDLVGAPLMITNAGKIVSFAGPTYVANNLVFKDDTGSTEDS